MSKTGENIYKRKDGRWEGRYIISHIGNKAKYGYVYAHTYSEAKNRLYKAAANKFTADKMCNSMGKYAEEWIKSVKPQLKESTVIRYENILALYILPYFANKPINKITTVEITDFANELLSCGGKSRKGLAAKTVTSILSVINSIFRFALSKNDVVKANIKAVCIRRERKEIRVLSISEQKKLTEYLYSDLTLTNLGILFCLYTGLRVGEICALKWENISFEDKTVTINKTMQRIKSNGGSGKTKISVTSPKSDCSLRTIPIPDLIVKELIPLKCDGGQYFLSSKQHGCVEPRTMQNRFKSILKKCGIKNASFHTLRHTFATRYIELGLDVKSLSEILGHAGVNITLSRYVHPSMDYKRGNMDRVAKLLAVR